MIEKTNLETIKHFDLRSIGDQVKGLYQRLHDAYVQIEDIKIELDSKVDLISKSQSLNSVTTHTRIGSGVISSTGISTGGFITFTGLGTFFTTEINPSGTSPIVSAIRIDATTYSIATISDNNTLTVVSDDDIAAFDKVFYAIVKPATAEQLIGDYEFGSTNGRLFNGRINQNSILQHYGRMADPFDVVNIEYVHRTNYPILIQALKAIKRYGDTVGNVDSGGWQRGMYTYNYRNCDFIFDNSIRNPSALPTKFEFNYFDVKFTDCNSIIFKNCPNVSFGLPGGPTTDVKYYGLTSDPNNMVVRKDLNDLKDSLLDSRFHANWWSGDPLRPGWGGQPEGKFKARMGDHTICPFDSAPDDASPNFLNKYFTTSANGLIVKPGIKCVITISVDVTTHSSTGSDIYQALAVITKSGALINFASGGYDAGGGNQGSNAFASVTSTITLNEGDLLVAGSHNLDNNAQNQEQLLWLSVSIMGYALNID